MGEPDTNKIAMSHVVPMKHAMQGRIQEMRKGGSSANKKLYARVSARKKKKKKKKKKFFFFATPTF